MYWWGGEMASHYRELPRVGRLASCSLLMSWCILVLYVDYGLESRREEEEERGTEERGRRVRRKVIVFCCMYSLVME